ncbi:membrane-associated protein [Plasticicumulans lactativorans]|uniref:Membrane-associated protein n=1 Tax=Plasticicumulans lactativorans TaxID=1133106 RepID=A0A4R2L2L5_9GAMM|nr:DedA family protein [Plasticicumulans lactativorans]TCO80583.1 membrane-associated protein [Plasticicumulans lactativorans]
MELLTSLIDIVLHLDKHLAELALQYGTWMYAILIAIIFCETGLVVTPFLPGDSLLFAAGSLAAVGALDVHVLFVVLTLAAIVGDGVNYHIGQYVGLKAFRPDARVLKTAYLEKTHAFYERHGGKTIIIARFVPIVRTFAPFVAGAGSMSYRRFLAYNVIGALIWTGSLLYAGYLFGNLPLVKENFSLVIIGIIIVSILPGVVEFIRHKRAAARA